MHFTIQKFTFLVMFVLISLLLGISTYYHFAQQEKTASVIIHGINSQMSETSYILSKNITNKKNAISSRPLLDRIASNNEFIAAIILHDGQNVLLTTDPHYNTILRTKSLYNDGPTHYKRLMQEKAMEADVQYYEGRERKILKLLFILDQKELSFYFERKQLDFLIYFIFLPTITLLFIWSSVKYFVVNPLEQLRQFAYYQNKVPKVFLLTELEVIRYSMVQTFQRLDNEKKELYAMARTDSLSGLANRNALNEYLERLISNASRKNKEFAFLFLDLDHFKSINDSLGHNVGDELLKKVASIIDEVLRSNSFVARVGGDEFVIILQDYHSLMDLTSIIMRVQDHLSKTWIIQTHPISISSSIGVAFYPKDGEDIISLMKHSDIAMYEAKKEGRARYHFFTEELNTRVQDTISLDKAMRKALENREYELYYQPKVELASGKIVGAEALIRWMNPEEGMIAPDLFIPLAEENGFILELGSWVFLSAIQQQKSFQERGIDLKVSINISAKQLLMDGFIDMFTETLKYHQVDPKDIDIEITEYMLLQQNKKNSQVLNELHDHGISISLDDFGTGYSSLSYLKKFPIDYLKIDKSFMDDFKTPEGSVFIETIVKMGQTLDIKIIAEGVEELEQIEYLQDIGCDQYQGYYFSKPLCVDDFEKLYLEKNAQNQT